MGWKPVNWKQAAATRWRAARRMVYVIVSTGFQGISTVEFREHRIRCLKHCRAVDPYLHLPLHWRRRAVLLAMVVLALGSPVDAETLFVWRPFCIGVPDVACDTDAD